MLYRSCRLRNGVFTDSEIVGILQGKRKTGRGPREGFGRDVAPANGRWAASRNGPRDERCEPEDEARRPALAAQTAVSFSCAAISASVRCGANISSSL